MGQDNRFIVITSILGPTEAVRRFARLDGYSVLVVGDRKSPRSYEEPGVAYLSPEEQQATHPRLGGALPWNHYCRKMVGYLAAMRGGATVIVDTDDDNSPYDDWSFPDFDGEFETTASDLGFVNVYRRFTRQHIWPRGLPLSRILEPDRAFDPGNMQVAGARVGVWQGLADGDPDVDAIYRLTSGAPCIFDQARPVVLGPNTISPFNSQNTAFCKAAFALLYLPAFVSFRYTDILRGLVAQPILWQAGYRLGFTQATVFQDRNPHDYMRDFADEVPCYLTCEKVVDIVSRAVRADSIPNNLRRAYHALAEAEIVTRQELDLLDIWLEESARATTDATP
jgi:hypothetical protein